MLIFNKKWIFAFVACFSSTSFCYANNVSDWWQNKSWHPVFSIGGGFTISSDVGPSSTYFPIQHEYVFSSGLTGGINTLNDFNAGLGDTLDFSGQTYHYSDTSSGILITLSGNAQVLLRGIHTFSSSWVVG